MVISKRIAVSVLMISSVINCPAIANEGQCNAIDWHRLNLSPQQSQQIQVLDVQWGHDYMQMEPGIVDDQSKLTGLLSDSKSDPLEIMALQQDIARKREQLRSTATANYLRKRQILNETQQRALEEMLRQAIAERQRAMNSDSQIDGMPERIQGLMHRIQSSFPGTQSNQ